METSSTAITMIPTDNTTAKFNDGIEQFIESDSLRTFRLVLFSLITLASLFGNFIVCKAVTSMPFHKPFSYQLVANMAIAEFISSICLPFMLAYRESREWILGKVGCSLVMPLQALSFFVVTSSMALISFYRFKVMSSPAAIRLSGKMKVLVISGTWLAGIIISIPQFVAYKLEDGLCRAEFQNSYIIARFILNFVVPYAVMVGSYGALACHLRQRIQARALETRGSLAPSTNALETEEIELEEIDANPVEETYPRQTVKNNNSTSNGSKTSAELEKDLLKMIYVIIIVFVACYFPYQVMFLWERIEQVKTFQFRHHFLLQKYVFIVTCLPSAIHPLCYGTMNKFYARAFSKIILCKAT